MFEVNFDCCPVSLSKFNSGKCVPVMINPNKKTVKRDQYNYLSH